MKANNKCLFSAWIILWISRTAIRKDTLDMKSPQSNILPESVQVYHMLRCSNRGCSFHKRLGGHTLILFSFCVQLMVTWSEQSSFQVQFQNNFLIFKHNHELKQPSFSTKKKFYFVVNRLLLILLKATRWQAAILEFQEVL